MKEIRAEKKTVDENDHHAFQKCAECRKKCDQARFAGVNSFPDNHGTAIDDHIQKQMTSEDRAGQTIHEEAEQKRQYAPAKGIEVKSRIDDDDDGDFHPDPSKGK